MNEHEIKQKLNSLPGEILMYKLEITKEFETWCICYASDYGYLKNKKKEICLFSDKDISVCIDKILDFVQQLNKKS